MLTTTFFALFTLLPLTLSAPLFGIGDDDENNAPTTPLAIKDLESKFLRSAQFARVAYCSSKAVTSLQCGGPCDALGKGVKVFQAGGDDGLVPLYYVANDPTDNSIVVAHEGTDPFNFLSVLNDAEFLLKDLNTTRITSGQGKKIQVHDGFQDTWERTADGVLDAVKRGLNDFKSTKVHVTGHSLGAAIATLDSLMLKQTLDPSIELKTTVFGMPRTGNQEFADFVDATLGTSFNRFTNQNDPVPRVPPQLLGYHHTSGEIFIKAVDDNGQATDVVQCPGQENENCGTGNSLKLDSIANHLGPYFDDISFSKFACPS
ncbi:alpha/beta-hydrolase [Marasmius fiardii PR-910]|nr:alpha/beta-hydrolase [Marasmius fiardii PR-910]